jgi:hypothetical protein
MSPAPLEFEPVALCSRIDGWTPDRQRAFVEELADCGVVREAAARVGMSEQSAYRLRRRAGAEAFNLAWEAAVQIGMDRLRSVAYERAVLGMPKARYYRGEKVGEDRVYSDRLLIYLLGRERRSCNSGRTHRAVTEWDRWMEAIEAGLAAPMLLPNETTRSPVWMGEDGHWWTSFPPPAGYDGDQFGTLGEGDYCRPLTAQEEETVRAWSGSREGEQVRRREAYFTRMKMEILPPH